MNPTPVVDTEDALKTGIGFPWFHAVRHPLVPEHVAATVLFFLPRTFDTTGAGTAAARRFFMRDLRYRPDVSTESGVWPFVSFVLQLSRKPGGCEREA
jgi:hypothetical protein